MEGVWGGAWEAVVKLWLVEVMGGKGQAEEHSEDMEWKSSLFCQRSILVIFISTPFGIIPTPTVPL